MQKNNILDNLKKLHNNDEAQINIITNKSNKIIVEASAGSGKTKVLISSIAYSIANNSLSSTKKILALTFSVNAAYKIKKDLVEQLPNLLNEHQIKDKYISKKVVVSNFHGLCKRILSIYGKSVYLSNINFNDCQIISDEELLKKTDLLTEDEKLIVKKTNCFITKGDIENFEKSYKIYNKIITNKLLSNNFLTYNSIISIVLEMFDVNTNIKKQYQSLFEYIIVDECQDTNVLGYLLLKKLVKEETKLMFFGDSLQRIYGFIGAIPNIMKKLEEEFQMDLIQLNYNYRFKDNKELLLLDKNIRINASNLNEIAQISNPNIICCKTYDMEYKWIINKIIELKKTNLNIAVLVKSANSNLNTEYLLKTFKNQKIDFFNALFTDESTEYVDFHKYCYSVFYSNVFEKRKVTKKVLENCFNEIKQNYQNTTNHIYISMLILLRHFIDFIYEIAPSYKLEDLLFFITEVLINNGLKQYMNRLNENVVVSTVHAYKGLETDIVFIVDMESNSFPGYYSCKNCCDSKLCNNYSINEKSFLEDLSVFYVAITRARIDLYLTYSESQLVPFGDGVKKCNKSCLLNLNGIGYDNCIMIVD